MSENEWEWEWERMGMRENDNEREWEWERMTMRENKREMAKLLKDSLKCHLWRTDWQAHY